MANQFGCTNVVAALGTSFTTGHGRILRRYAKKVVLVFDSDAAGIEAANRALDVCLSLKIDIKLASIPQGKDPCDFLLANGKEKFQQLIDDAVDVLQFKWDRLTEKLDADDTFAGRKAAIDEYLHSIATSIYAGTLKSIEGGLLVNRLSKIIGLDNKAIIAALSKASKTAEKMAGYTEQKQNIIGADLSAIRVADLGQGLAASAQREILEVLLNEPKLFETVKQKISLDHFDVPALKQTAAILFETLNSCPEPELMEILAKTESPQVSSCITQLQHTGQEKGNFEARLTDAVNALLQSQARKQTSEIKAIEDQTRFLRSVTERTSKENPHNVGMT
jgi:DNA primase